MRARHTVTGANGKSVFLQTIAAALGSYAATATLDTFMASRSDRHLTELAGLRGARVVLVPETEAGRSWNEPRIKTVTGGEAIRANLMRSNHFEFTPQFKLLIAGNHRPALTSVGEAMQRRLHLVPFDVTIPPSRRDKKLMERLRGKLSGILSWMLEGCSEWQRIGLNPPERVLIAAQQYFEAEDHFGQWLAERCDINPDHCCRSSELFQSWKAWAEQNGTAAGSMKSFGDELRARGFVSCSVGRSRGWRGLTIALPDHGSKSTV